MVTHKTMSVKEELEKALIKMLIQKNYIDITVSDLIKTAQVARVSFYRNFKSIDDVLESITNGLIENFNINIIPVIIANDERKWRELLFEMLYRIIQIQKYFEISFQELANKNFNIQIIFSRVQKKLQQIEQGIPNLTVEEKYLLVGKLNFVFGVVIKWALTGMEEPPEDIVNIILPTIKKL